VYLSSKMIVLDVVVELHTSAASYTGTCCTYSNLRVS
jgi:hypothetical protein